MTKTSPADLSISSTLRTDLAKVEWDGDNSPRALDFDDVYFSSAGAEAETEHVFLYANNLALRWATLKHSHKPFTIGEIGFGSGLNFAKTLQLWEAADEKPAKLHYIAFEKHPLTREDMARAHSNWPHLRPFFDRLLTNYWPFSRVCYRLSLAHSVTLDIHFGDALTRLGSLHLAANAGIDSWFLDGFSPRLNAELWSEALCQELARLSADRATLSTYSAAGWVRANLTNAGFDVIKSAGFAGKRHMLKAEIRKPSVGAAPPKAMAAWAISSSLPEAATSAVVIGAGLAGASAAYALARRGIKVNIIESSVSVADGASGVQQLALRPRLFKEGSPAAEFYLQAYLFAGDQYRALQTEGNQFWQQCGVLQSIQAQNKKQPLSAQQLALIYGDHIVQTLNSEQAFGFAKLPVIGDYLLFKTGGWIDPVALCATYLCHPNITVNLGIQIDAIENRANQWLSKQHKSDREFKSDVVVLANGLHAKQFSQTCELALQAVRGQATYIAASPVTSRLAAVVTGERSVFPAFKAQHTVSASYRREAGLTPSAQDDLDNLTGMVNLFSEDTAIKDRAIGSKVALRCNSSDFLPVIGAVADTVHMKTAFANLKRNAQATTSGNGHYYQGLYITAGHGSNGAATCPLAAEHIASLIAGEPSSVSMEMVTQLSPARFMIRDIKRQI